MIENDITNRIIALLISLALYVSIGFVALYLLFNFFHGVVLCATALAIGSSIISIIKYYFRY